ncbi:MAG: retron system putative HNH endonuclease [Snowella sp.]|nr:retron system putative HNH endonuclease [Snowella sp.]
MRYIQKQEAPPEFTQWKEQNPLADYERLGKKASNKIKKIVHQSLLTEQGYICCYCQRRIDLNNSHIEHLKPKDENLYPELALDYNNLLASCQKMNKKGEPRHCGSLKDNWYDEKLMVSPLEENCAEYFSYTVLGEILPSENKKKNESAKTTIEKLGLDIRKLRSERRAAIEEFFTGIELSREDIEIYIREFDKVNDEGQYDQFCNVLIYVLKKYF